jgi:hypothetical protein
MQIFSHYASDPSIPVVVQFDFDKEASQTRSYCGASFSNKSGAPQRAARPGPSLRKERLLRMTTKLHHYPRFLGLGFHFLHRMPNQRYS